MIGLIQDIKGMINLIIKEIGLYLFRSTCSAYENYLMPAGNVPIVMIGRKVLETPITLADGECYTFSYTIFYDLYWIFENPFLNALRDIGAGVFILISGACCVFSRNNFKRGMITFFAGIVVTVVTVLYNNGDQQILWGILHFLGLSIILYDLIEKPLSKIKWYIALPIFAVLFILTFGLKNGTSFGGYVGVPFIRALQWEIPYSFSSISFLFPLGITSVSFFSSDYFPLFPWFFLFLIGSLYGRRLKEERAMKFVYKTHVRPLAFVGRHALIIYLLHQPVIYGIVELIKLF